MPEDPNMMFIVLVRQQEEMGWIALGKQPHPATGTTEPSLDHARYCIDVLEMLEAKTEGNLVEMERSLLTTTLTNLRLNFVDVQQKEAAKDPSGDAETGDTDQEGAPERGEAVEPDDAPPEGESPEKDG